MQSAKTSQTETHSSSSQQSPSLLKRWKWAYRKIHSMDCSMIKAAWRATRFALFGNSGRFLSSRGWTKLKVSSD
ncbi:hypothetical protein KRX52_08000 [Pseudomonas sp. MAP12]|uniref:Uncharacterized protein n=1 Tax=Geopseudomonas aromaticivorans TaxID=2849492 RepID=A0ABS6MV98_9GAMM|nr:hypothetical protein [Pseudomonas aromaticivorans]MBV2132743.1 hypothetical protein [Pseudomonas aromaticivorans]